MSLDSIFEIVRYVIVKKGTHQILCDEASVSGDVSPRLNGDLKSEIQSSDPVYSS